MKYENMKGMATIDWQKYGERFALNILTDELRIPRDSIIESESPDFIFNYEGKQIGAEIVEYHRNSKETEARNAYQKAIDRYKGKKGKLTSVIVFDENVTAFNRKKSEEQLLDEIDNLLTDEYYDAQHLQSADEWEIDSESEFPTSVCSIGVSQHVNTEILEQTIRKKEKKLSLYKNLHKSIDEYWLIVYVNMYEYDYFENMEKPEISSSYDRIYLTHIVDRTLRIK
ncbi:MAG: hypothetical protein IJ588_02005 [Prevotella sp.]|nr:hypothetical protein [Prevotella sp.]